MAVALVERERLGRSGRHWRIEPFNELGELFDDDGVVVVGIASLQPCSRQGATRSSRNRCSVRLRAAIKNSVFSSSTRGISISMTIPISRKRRERRLD
jgi:hypothetical protein